jgi:hypothetical protein
MTRFELCFQIQHAPLHLGGAGAAAASATGVAAAAASVAAAATTSAASTTGGAAVGGGNVRRMHRPTPADFQDQSGPTSTREPAVLTGLDIGPAPWRWSPAGAHTPPLFSST